MRTLKYIFAWILLTASSSCSKLVDVDPPATRLITATVFDNNSTAIAATTSIYSQLFNSNLSYNIALYTGLSSDELKNYSTSNSVIQFYINSINATNNGLIQPSLWQPLYNFIYQSNAVIEGLQSSTGVSPEVKQQLIGEAKFIRAFCHFYLVNLFGEIPIVTTTDYLKNNGLSRSSNNAVYQTIINDLKDAQALLSSKFLSGNTISSSNDRVRPTKWAASAMLARVYLYIGDWANAEIQATSVTDNTSLFSLESNLNNVFLKSSMEAIWQILPVQSGINTNDGLNFILTGAPFTNNSNCTTLSDTLFNSFESTDNRKSSWVGSANTGVNTFYYPAKYKIQYGSSLSEYLMVLRLAEQFLIRAEARAQLNKINESQSDLNKIRTRAGLQAIFPSDKPSLLSAIEQERKIELFSEWGHRWFDLKRTMRINAIMPVISPLKGGTWDTNKQLFPIPQKERDNDPYLSQNPGY